ncbi:hypothetical+protein [Methylocapsa aurea]|uniref:hypothetical protein n=1 Tax=Methylocapsa aurea TaxID=663610 RepID=UPI003D1888D3
MLAKNTQTVRSLAPRKDGRRSLLLYLNSDVIKALKRQALEQERHAYEIAEEAIAAWLNHDAQSASKNRKA